MEKMARWKVSAVAAVLGLALAAAAVFLCGSSLRLSVDAQGPLPFEYVSPPPGACLVSAGTTVAIRPGDILDEGSLSDGLFTIVGSESGVHTGRVILADDRETVVFDPDRPFAPGETVAVRIGQGLRTARGVALDGAAFEFTVSPKAVASLMMDEAAAAGSCDASDDVVGLPADFPTISVTVPASGAAEGYLFLASLRWPGADPSIRSYLLILDDSGEPVYYKRCQYTLDFKKQPNGMLTYWDYADNFFSVIDASYTVVDTVQAGNGYEINRHDLQILPSGHYLLTIYDPQPVDMSKVVPGGDPNATVVGLVIQELDASKNVVFEWRSWDHFEITDSNQDLTASTIDYVHGNSVELDLDGNLLICSRNLDEVTKIDRGTGDVIWRLGGKQNEFAFLNDPRGFAYPHDARQLPNGHLTIFDNGNTLSPEYSRALEYAVDEDGKTVELVWEYRNVPDSFGPHWGNVQRLPNGNTMIGWGDATPMLTEVMTDGTKVLELDLVGQISTYRALRSPWQGDPAYPPSLIVETGSPTLTLRYSWNGATEVVSYHIRGGQTPYTATVLIGTQVRTGFETTTTITDTGVIGDACYLWVTAVNGMGDEMAHSNAVFVGGMECLTDKVYLPLVDSAAVTASY
jgi:hypothetical protein